MREEQAAAQAHAVSLEGRRRAVISGVQAVDSFNEQMVTLITGEMRLYAVMGSLAGFLLYGATLSPLIALIGRALVRLLRALGGRLWACAFVRRLLK